MARGKPNGGHRRRPRLNNRNPTNKRGRGVEPPGRWIPGPWETEQDEDEEKEER